VREVLAEVGAQDLPEIVVVNKVDAADAAVVQRLLLRERRAVAVSARTGAGIEQLVEVLAEVLPRPDVEVDALVPYSRGDLVHRVHAEGEVLAEEHQGDGTRLHARVGPGLASELTRFATAPR
jgi:GTP-binding protein HflX